jgi:chromosome segregation ATPase
MKIKVIIVILAVACLGLGIAFFVTKQQGEEQHEKDVSSINDFSNQLVGANAQLDGLRQDNLTLTNQLVADQQQLASNQQQLVSSLQQLSTTKEVLAQLSNDLATASATLASTKTSLATAQDQIMGLNTHISDLETQNKVLDQRANDLTNIIAQLNATIEDTKNKLAISETNGAFLQQELQKQMAQKAELEHKFNDLEELRAQVKKMRDEMFVARRLHFMKNDNSSKKGAELLIQRSVPDSNTAAGSSNLPRNYDLNVEVGSDGSVKVIPPLNRATNSAAH